MGDHSTPREYGWTESSGSEVSDDPHADESDSHSSSSDEFGSPFARHGPLIQADPDSIDMQRVFWHHCAMGYFMDYWKFSVTHFQQLINRAWRLQGEVKVVGRDSLFYILHFGKDEDLDHMCSKGPWSVDGALLVLEKWRPNIPIHKLQLNYISIWVQLHGLPLEYQYPEFAEHLGHMIGFCEKVDWEDKIPRNIRFMRVKVRLDSWMPVFAGFVLKMDDGVRTWIQCHFPLCQGKTTSHHMS